MKAKHKAMLIEAINQWSEKLCETQTPEIPFWGECTIESMADAAGAVYDGITEAQNYAKKEGAMA